MRQRLLARLYRLMDSPQGAALGALVYGGWAFHVNRVAGFSKAALIGSAHWLMSVVITLSCVRLMRVLFWWPARPLHGALLAGSGSVVAAYSLLIGVHLAIGTPNILMTLALGLPPTLAFAFTYSALLLRESADPDSLACRRRRAALAGGGPHARA